MSAVADPSGQTRKPPVVQPNSGNSIIINPCQRLNPMLDCIRNVNKEFGDIVPDFQMGRTTCALFLSLKYHRLHPEYIHQRIQRLGQTYTLRILLLLCDISEHQEPIRELTKICLVNNITIIISWSNEEAGMYLSTYKAFEHKPPDLIKERIDKEYNAVLRSALTSINRVNKTDVETLRMTFGSFARIAHATPEELQRLPGFGQVKVRRLVDAFEKPFRNNSTSAFPVTPAQVQAETLLHDRANDGREESAGGEESVALLGPATREAGKQLTTLREEISSAASTQNPNPATTSTQSSLAGGVHAFGSAADMPTPTPTPASSHATGNAERKERQREPSPVWDIELDLNLPSDEDGVGVLEFKDHSNGKKLAAESEMEKKDEVDPRLAKKRRGTAREDDGEKDIGGGKSPIPVWDIELDLNDD